MIAVTVFGSLMTCLAAGLALTWRAIGTLG